MWEDSSQRKMSWVKMTYYEFWKVKVKEKNMWTNEKTFLSKITSIIEYLTGGKEIQMQVKNCLNVESI